MSMISFSWDGTNPDALTEIPCPRCRSFLIIHLPDPQLPERLLGTCVDCKSWYLMDGLTATMIGLPDGRSWHDAPDAGAIDPRA